MQLVAIVISTNLFRTMDQDATPTVIRGIISKYHPGRKLDQELKKKVNKGFYGGNGLFKLSAVFVKQILKISPTYISSSQTMLLIVEEMLCYLEMAGDQEA